MLTAGSIIQHREESSSCRLEQPAADLSWELVKSDPALIAAVHAVSKTAARATAQASAKGSSGPSPAASHAAAIPTSSAMHMACEVILPAAPMTMSTAGSMSQQSEESSSLAGAAVVLVQPMASLSLSAVNVIPSSTAVLHEVEKSSPSTRTHASISLKTSPRVSHAFSIASSAAHPASDEMSPVTENSAETASSIISHGRPSRLSSFAGTARAVLEQPAAAFSWSALKDPASLMAVEQADSKIAASATAQASANGSSGPPPATSHAAASPASSATHMACDVILPAAPMTMLTAGSKIQHREESSSFAGTARAELEQPAAAFSWSALNDPASLMAVEQADSKIAARATAQASANGSSGPPPATSHAAASPASSATHIA